MSGEWEFSRGRSGKVGEASSSSNVCLESIKTFSNKN